MKKEYFRNETIQHGSYNFTFRERYSVMGSILDQYWSVKVHPDCKDQEYFEDIPEVFEGYPIKNINDIFDGCTKMRKIPKILANIKFARYNPLVVNRDLFPVTGNHPFCKIDDIVFISWFSINEIDLVDFDYTETEDKIYLHYCKTKYRDEYIFVPGKINNKQVVLQPNIISKKFSENVNIYTGHGIFEGTEIHRIVFDDSIEFDKHAFVRLFKNCRFELDIYNLPLDTIDIIEMETFNNSKRIKVH